MKFRIKDLTIFQKINYYLIISLGISIILIFIGTGVDIYKLYIGYLPFKLSESYSLLFFWIVLFFHFCFVLPNTFTIYVHEMRKQIHPKIPFWYNVIKNTLILILIALILIPLFIYPFLASDDPSSIGFVTKYLVEKRHTGIKTGYLDTFFTVIITISFCIPLVGILNWFHAMSWKGYVFFKKMLISKTSN